MYKNLYIHIKDKEEIFVIHLSTLVILNYNIFNASFFLYYAIFYEQLTINT